MPIKHLAIIEISKSALENNIGFMRRSFGAKTRISSVVKANAYGMVLKLLCLWQRPV